MLIYKKSRRKGMIMIIKSFILQVEADSNKNSYNCTIHCP